MKKARIRCLSLILTMVMALSACGGQGGTTQAPAASSTPASSSSAASEPAGPVYGGTLIMAGNLQPNTLHSQQKIGQYGALVLQNVQEGLLSTDQETGEIVPVLAESYEVSDDQCVYTFHLREGVTFHDGTPFNADDVIYTFQYLTGEIEGGLYAENFEGMLSEVKKVDDYTVEMTLTAPWEDFMNFVTSSYCTLILSKESVEAAGENYGAATAVGTGPFKFAQDWVKGETIKLTKNEDYWQEGLPYLDGVEFRYIKDASARLIAAQSGEVDIMNDPDADHLPLLQKEDSLEIVRVPGNVVMSMQVNTESHPFNDVRVRQAMYYAMNREELVQATFGDTAEVAYDLLPYWHYASDRDYQYYEYNPEKAIELLAEAGYTEDNPLEFMLMCATDSVQAGLCTLYQAQLAEIGVKCDVRPLESATRLSITYGRDGYSRDEFDAIITRQQPDSITDEYMHKYYHPNGAGNKTGYNQDAGGAQNPKVVELIDQARASGDQAERTELYREAIELIDLDAVRVPILYMENVAVVSENVNNYFLQPTVVSELREVWLSE